MSFKSLNLNWLTINLINHTQLAVFVVVVVVAFVVVVLVVVGVDGPVVVVVVLVVVWPNKVVPVPNNEHRQYLLRPLISTLQARALSKL